MFFVNLDVYVVYVFCLVILVYKYFKETLFHTYTDILTPLYYIQIKFKIITLLMSLQFLLAEYR